jgi:AmmeMemoRadiSam system protein B/AmmeMemoRadiSam system protein A
MPVLLLLGAACATGQQKEKHNMEYSSIAKNRTAVVAGQFYPSDSATLSETVTNFLQNSGQNNHKRIRALIVPHAGYVFSGQVAGSAYSLLQDQKPYKNIFILGASHHKYFHGASIYTPGNYETPLGEAKINGSLANKLVSDNKQLFHYVAEAHQLEHSIEVQLPFLQTLYGNNFNFIPVLIGDQSAETSRKIATSLEPYFTDENLFIISTDFSHYPAYNDAVINDQKTAEAVESKSEKEFIDAINIPADHQINNLLTSMCGWPATLALIYLTRDNEKISIVPLEYQNSGDSPYGEKDRVVGYYAMAAEEDTGETKKKDFALTEQDKSSLLGIARESITTFLQNKKIPEPDPSKLDDNLKEKTGAFVTLHTNDGKLQGCIGHLKGDLPLYRVIQRMAVAAATEDKRFNPLTLAEINNINIEISVLTPMKHITGPEEYDPSKQGIYMKKGHANGTFLPQVAAQTNWSKEELLGHCARDKAHIGWNGWKTAELYVYEAIIFGEKKSEIN